MPDIFLKCHTQRFTVNNGRILFSNAIHYLLVRKGYDDESSGYASVENKTQYSLEPHYDCFIRDYSCLTKAISLYQSCNEGPQWWSFL